MEKCKTSFRVTSATQQLEKKILEATEYSQTVFQKKAIDYYINGDRKIDPRLQITAWSDPEYVKRDAVEQIYIDSGRKAILENIAAEQNCKLGTVLFQALLDYCVQQAGLLFPEEM